MKLTSSNTFRLLKEKGLGEAVKHRLDRILRENIFIDLFVPIAWNLGLKMPKGCKFVYISSHATGHNAMLRFLVRCGIFTNYYYLENGYVRYNGIYKRLIKDHKQYNIISISEYNFKDDKKFFSSITEKMPALVLVRDPISVLKSGLNLHVGWSDKGKTIYGGGGGGRLASLSA